MFRAKLITNISGDWQGLYIDNVLIDEGHKVGYQDFYFVKISEEYSLRYTDFKTYSLNDEDDKKLSIVGSFPEKLEDLYGNYE